MKKLLCLIFLVFCLASCSASNISLEDMMLQNDVTYDIETATWNDNQIYISYPQIKNLSNYEKQMQINNLIRDEAIKIIDRYVAAEALKLEIKYDIKLRNDKVLSVAFDGVGYVDGAPYPNNLFHTVNVDVQTGDKFRFDDVMTPNDRFVKTFKAGIEFSNLYAKQILDAIPNEELLMKLRNADTGKGEHTYTYFTDKSLGISLETIHALGDHIEYEIKYEYLLK